MSDIVERLRDQAERCDAEDRLDLSPDAALMREAADAIERKDAEIERLRNEIAAFKNPVKTTGDLRHPPIP